MTPFTTLSHEVDAEIRCDWCEARWHILDVARALRCDAYQLLFLCPWMMNLRCQQHCFCMHAVEQLREAKSRPSELSVCLIYLLWGVQWCPSVDSSDPSKVGSSTSSACLNEKTECRRYKRHNVVYDMKSSRHLELMAQSVGTEHVWNNQLLVFQFPTYFLVSGYVLLARRPSMFLCKIISPLLQLTLLCCFYLFRLRNGLTTLRAARGE